MVACQAKLLASAQVEVGVLGRPWSPPTHWHRLLINGLEAGVQLQMKEAEHATKLRTSKTNRRISAGVLSAVCTAAVFVVVNSAVTWVAATLPKSASTQLGALEETSQANWLQFDFQR